MNKYYIRVLFTSIFLCMSLFLLGGCSDSAPKKVVKTELGLIQQLDENTIKSFISYKDMVHSESPSEKIDSQAAETIKLFFKNFSYKIRSSKVNGDHASVTVDIKNLDTKTLAKDLCKSLIAQNASLETNSQAASRLTPYFTLLRNCLTENQYDITKTTAEIPLIKTGDNWTLEGSDQLEDSLVSGFVSHLNDPYLLSPEDVLSIYMEGFKDLSPEEWVKYLDMHDIFATGNELYPSIDLALADQIAKHFDYSIKDVVHEDNAARINVDITSLDLEKIFQDYAQQLMKYAGNPESLRASDSELSDKTSQYLLDSLKNNAESITKTIDIKLINNGSTWVMQLDDHFTDALLGDIKSAMESFNQAGTESETESESETASSMDLQIEPEVSTASNSYHALNE